MNNLWSTKIQSTELLYYSRLERFNDENCSRWFDLLKVKDGMKVLEVGCGGGHFTNMVKKYFPNCEVWGIDLDTNHINFAKNKCKELGLDVKYLEADINNLPFEDESFDLIFSHTVVEHLPFENFITEQYRTLKKGGHLVIMKVAGGVKDNPYMYLEDEIGKVFDKLEFEDRPIVGKYNEEIEQRLNRLHKYGFKNLGFSYDRFVYYCPDIEDNKQKALQQINLHFDMIRYNAIFNIQSAQNGEEHATELLDLLDKQYAIRKNLYLSGEKVYDYVSSNILTMWADK
ncbi:MAG: class I SAM-dependent methyltransferase [Clostridia bacterium]|nr:class I SAM-dependent methyltransferase [Clostridia bacterium]